MRKKLIIDPNRLFIDKPLGRYDPNNDWFEKQRAKKPEPEPAPKPGNRQQETGGRQQETGGSMIIVPLNKKLPYLEAFRLVSEMKKQLPSHALHDDYLVMTEQWEQIKDIYPAWAREIIAYPAKGKAFQRGKDIVDSETGWVLPASYVEQAHQAKDVFKVKKAVLFIDPENITEENGKTIVQPRKIIVLHNVILHNVIEQLGNPGKADEQTRIPLETTEAIADKQKRWFWRIDGIGLRPLARGRSNWYDSGRRLVDGGCRPDCGFGVAYEDPAGVARLKGGSK